jgi:Tfp pilus assembly protein PilX
MPRSTPFGAHASLPSRIRGAVLFIALIVLVAMTLAGIAIMRSVDTATLIAGNLAFKQGTV